MSGTPLEESLDDLISVLDLLLLVVSVQALSRAGCVDYWAMFSYGAGGSDDYRSSTEALGKVLLDREPRQRRLTIAPNGGHRPTHSSGNRSQNQPRAGTILRLKQICNFCPETGASSKLVDLRER